MVFLLESFYSAQTFVRGSVAVTNVANLTNVATGHKCRKLWSQVSQTGHKCRNSFLIVHKCRKYLSKCCTASVKNVAKVTSVAKFTKCCNPM